MSISYSDLILIRQPYAYCRMQEDAQVYCDASGNKRHLYTGYYDSTNNQPVITASSNSQKTMNFGGEPFIQGMEPVDGSVNEDAEDNNGYHGFDGLAIHNIQISTPRKMYGEFLLTGFPIYFTDFHTVPVWSCVAAVGPIRIIHKSYFDEDENLVSQEYKIVVIVDEFPYVECYTQSLYASGQSAEHLLTDSYRFILGIEEVSSTQFKFSCVINDDVIQSDVLYTTTGQFSLHEHYQTVGFACPGTAISNCSLFYNRDFPDDDYVADSWAVLNSTYTASTYSGMVKRSSQEQIGTFLDNYPGSMLTFLDNLLIFGFGQTLVTSITVTNQRTIKATIGIVSELPYTIHNFYIGDIIQVENSSQNSVNGIWEVSAIDFGTITFVVDNTATNETDANIIIKKAPLGGGSWNKTSAGYSSTDLDALDSSLVIYDSGTTVSVRMTNSSHTSQALYWRKDLMKNRIHMIRWQAVGDNRRFYLFIAYRTDFLDYAQVYVYGDVCDLVDDTWRTVLIAHKDANIGNIGLNFAFLYPDWSILPTGHLLCQARDYESSDSKWVRTSDLGLEYIKGYFDEGHHIYPVPYPFNTLLS